MTPEEKVVMTKAQRISRWNAQKYIILQVNSIRENGL